ncbi:MAG: GNAT family N-acetyltransferase [Anaerolineales bacterium]|nr:GNAT family N-acetyltransferase [Anaerolineales bacterium]
MTKINHFTYRQRPELVAEANRINPSAWPEFMLHDPISNQHWGKLDTHFKDFQFVLCDQDDKVVAVGNSIPVTWEASLDDLPERGWDALLEKGVRDQELGQAPNLLCALSAVVAEQHRAKRLSIMVIEGMRDIASWSGFDWLVAPVRPSLKSTYPLTPMERYIKWLREDGKPFDPWIRVHWGLGAVLVKVAPQSMTISGSIAEWEEWTGVQLPESGVYIVPGALEPVHIDCEAGIGKYMEPNVWMKHEIKHQ